MTEKIGSFFSFFVNNSLVYVFFLNINLTREKHINTFSEMDNALIVDIKKYPK